MTGYWTLQIRWVMGNRQGDVWILRLGQVSRDRAAVADAIGRWVQEGASLRALATRPAPLGCGWRIRLLREDVEVVNLAVASLVELRSALVSLR